MLKRHESVHVQQRGFTCQACEKWFPTRSALVRHERTHTGKEKKQQNKLFLYTKFLIYIYKSTIKLIWFARSYDNWLM